jgi:hypothetical protein
LGCERAEDRQDAHRHEADQSMKNFKSVEQQPAQGHESGLPGENLWADWAASVSESSQKRSKAHKDLIGGARID